MLVDYFEIEGPAVTPASDSSVVEFDRFVTLMRMHAVRMFIAHV